ncbi:MAG: hypothetical protein EGQ74_15495 [Bacteroides nordii]|nr:hypothetical protein [Bacteroides nordii]
MGVFKNEKHNRWVTVKILQVPEENLQYRLCLQYESILFVMPVFYIGVFLTFYWFKLNFAQGELVLFMLLCSINISYL